MIIGANPIQGWYSSTTTAPEVYPLDVVPVMDPEADGFKGKGFNFLTLNKIF